MNIYRHKKNGKLYELVSDHLMFKDYTKVYVDSQNELFRTSSKSLDWRGNLILYRCLYQNPDGPYFVRLGEDFTNSFEKIKLYPINDNVPSILSMTYNDEDGFIVRINNGLASASDSFIVYKNMEELLKDYIIEIVNEPNEAI